jgi:tripartite-type tricarboxylate transporter receptor subunit TctC
MKTMRRRTIALCACLLAVIYQSFAACAASATTRYPDRPIHLVVGYTPGGGADIFARLLSQKLSAALQEAVIVDNKPGAAQNIAATYVARSHPDGYTLFLSSSALSVNVNLYPKLGYDPIKDFEPVALFAQSPNLLLVNAALPVKTVQELIAYARSHPGQLNFSSSGSGGTQHLCGALLQMMTGTQMTHVPYKGTAPAMTAVASGQVQFTFSNVPSAKPLLAGGMVRAIATTSRKRLGILPNLPTMVESGLPGFDVAAWYGVLAPAGTPVDVVERLNAVIAQISKQPEFRKSLDDLGTETVIESPAAFSAFLKSDIVRWQKVLVKAHVTVE